MPRRLSDEDREVWQRVARTARRLSPGTAPAGLDQPTPPVSSAKNTMPRPATPMQVAPLAQRVSPPAGPRTRIDLAPSVSDHLANQPVQMDRNLHTKMMRGKLDPEARIDLHGMTVAQAHHVLIGFIIHAHQRGLRLVLVITGKGRTSAPDHAAPMPARAGVLKHEVPQWLRGGALGQMVLEIRESHRSHGGTGAYYVYLRKRR
ncbi:MAG: Smr/MutS family protein [Paracoccaceae bacterium]